MLSPAGGEYQYSLTMLEALIQSPERVSPGVILASEVTHPALDEARQAGWSVTTLDASGSKQLSRRILNALPFRHFLWDVRRWMQIQRYRPDIDRIRADLAMRRHLQATGAGLMLYPSPITMSFEAGIPFIMAIHDLQHRLQPEFPEVSAGGEFERREYLFRNGARNATLLLADSEVGREDILNCYEDVGVRPEQVRVLPFLPAAYLRHQPDEAERSRVRRKYDLPDRYLFYPAQFWPHKNHERIVEALGRLRERDRMTVPVVFSGSVTDRIRRQTFRSVMIAARRLGLERDIRYLGYVPDNDISVLYRECAALIFPTFFGPTNIPVLEAWSMGCPVITSDIRGIREQCGDAALLVDPRSPDAIADAIRRIWTDEALGTALAARGRVQLGQYTKADFTERLCNIVSEALERISAVGVPAS